MKKIYLDHAAATPMDAKVLAAMRPYFAEKFYNPSSLYLASKAVAADIAAARKNVAKWSGARLSEIIFTAGGTEANNLAIQGVMRAHPGSNLLISAVEHESVSKPAQLYSYREVAVDTEGLVDSSDLIGKIDDRTVLVSVIYANNEIGTIQPLARIAKIIKDVHNQRQKSGNDLPLYLHTDACQAGNYLSLQVARLGVDLMTLNGGKLYGPKQSGALYVGSHVTLDPLIFGGGQERSLRAGTENVPAIIGFAAALEAAQSLRNLEQKRLSDLQQLFLGLLGNNLPTARVNGPLTPRLANNINISLPGEDNERLVMALDEAGVQCASGSACSALRGEPSHVLRAIGLDELSARNSLRFSMGRETDEEAIRRTVKILMEQVARSQH